MFVSDYQATTVCLQSRIWSSRLYFLPCCSNRRVFCQSSLPYEKELRRLLSAAPSRRDLSTYVYFLRFATGCGTTSGADKRGLFGVYVDSINIISWSKQEVGPVVYVTELGTLESATAPYQTVPMLCEVLGWTP